MNAHFSASRVALRKPGLLKDNTMRHVSTGLIGVVAFLVVSGSASGSTPKKKPQPTLSREVADGRDLFVEIWEPGEQHHPGGDGLGPLFNEKSCVGCHNLGGTGGSGPNKNNVSVMTAVESGSQRSEFAKFLGELEELHPGFKSRRSIVVHTNSANLAEDIRLLKIRRTQTVQTRESLFALISSERNTPALFGAGLIDALPDKILLDAEARKYREFPEISGRVSKPGGDQIGRFGWKGQTSRLHDFVLGACSNELGFEVPGHHQVSLAPAKDFDSSKLKLDLDEKECRNIIKYIASLPAPSISSSVARPGLEIFEKIGCAACHTPTLGPIQGLFSDLLLHDLGDKIASSGFYGGNAPIVDRSESLASTNPTGPATANEWRTPPLWGVANSGPYMHDGRARTFAQAIELHGGEAEATLKRFNALSNADRKSIINLLSSLTAPGITRAEMIKKAPKPAQGLPR